MRHVDIDLSAAQRRTSRRVGGRSTRAGAQDASTHLGRLIGQIGHTALVLEPWKDAFAIRRAFCLAELVHTELQSTSIVASADEASLTSAAKLGVAVGKPVEAGERAVEVR